MRGTLTHRPRIILQVGIIPAHAGNTWDARWRASWCWDHPPHMRGTHITNERPDRRVGIIPAHAGNTRAWRPCRPWPRDHPRACGEHSVQSGLGDAKQGSSPRMRGTPRRPHRRFAHDGIIPAHAGNTCGGLRCTMSTRDHPRACGEHFNQLYLSAQKKGSSPRMRGTPYVAHEGACCRGIIPAHAGNTFTNLRLRKGTWDHPRACGEHRRARPRFAGQRGSSPRMRGTLISNWVGGFHRGIIPAHAGNTSRRNHNRRLYGDHPRACGEHADNSSMTFNSEGSSPRMRGTPQVGGVIVAVKGIIPAHAGNTHS